MKGSEAKAPHLTPNMTFHHPKNVQHKPSKTYLMHFLWFLLRNLSISLRMIRQYIWLRANNAQLAEHQRLLVLSRWNGGDRISRECCLLAALQHRLLSLCGSKHMG